MEDIGWDSMEHAYGPADEVPVLIRGLVDPDPAVRERALDAMYGAVHHQGDVYDCTPATVPFLLEALTTTGVPGRDGIAGLLASIGAAEEWPVRDERVARARDLIAAADLGRADVLAISRLGWPPTRHPRSGRPRRSC
jgi:hypothetical protein